MLAGVGCWMLANVSCCMKCALCSMCDVLTSESGAGAGAGAG